MKKETSAAVKKAATQEKAENKLDYERIRTFVKSYIKEDSEKLEEIYSSAVEREVPVIREDTRDYLRLLLNQVKPVKVLDNIGEYHIDTIELDDVRAEEAQGHITEFGKEDKIHLYRGDAAEVLKTLTEKYDFIFIDAAKAQYMNYLQAVMKLVHADSVIVTDNVLESGLVLESHFLVEKRDRTIHDKLREYLYTLKNDERLETAILSIGDGVAVSVVKKI